MATLSDSAEWVGVYQLETTDPVVGGAPNEGTGAGMSNIPHLHLAKRTAFLKAVIDAAGIGASIGPEAANFNTVTTSGLYWGANATGAPTSDAYVLLHIQGSAEDSRVQIAARLPSDAVYFRRRIAAGWQGWQEIAHAGNVTALLGGLDGFVTLTGDQSIEGAKTFTSPVSVGAPTAAGHAATRGYVDTITGGAVGGLVPDTRAISAGSGLSGGGTLEADRTLSADFATALELVQGAAHKVVSPSAIRTASEFQVHNGGSVTPNFNAHRNFLFELTANATIEDPIGKHSGQSGEFVFVQGSSARTVTFDPVFRFIGGPLAPFPGSGQIAVVSYRVVSPSLIVASFAAEAL